MPERYKNLPVYNILLMNTNKIMSIDKTSIIITLFILLILVVASPAQAAINVDPNEIPGTVPLGDAFEFDVTINEGDILPFSVILVYNESKDEEKEIKCKFDRHGNNLKKDHNNDKACRGIKIRKPGHEYGYGYGYGYGVYKYRIRIETNKGFIKEEGPGIYSLTVKAGSPEYKYEDTFEVVANPGNNGDNGNHGDGNNGKGNGNK